MINLNNLLKRYNFKKNTLGENVPLEEPDGFRVPRCNRPRALDAFRKAGEFHPASLFHVLFTADGFKIHIIILIVIVDHFRSGCETAHSVFNNKEEEHYKIGRQSLSHY